jgi:Rib/alpha/Esp surface antigen-like repeat protein
MKATPTALALLAFLAGCGSCESPQQGAPAGGGGAAASPTNIRVASPAGTIQVAPLRPTISGREVPTAPAQGAPTAATMGETPSAGAGVPPAGGGAENGDEGDCIVIGDASPDYGAPPLEVEFSAEAECSTGQAKYKWDFGDGSAASNDPNATHTYSRAGEYTAVVTVTGPDGSTSTDEIDITVEEEAAELE